MKIILIGNIASGKSSMAKLLKNKYKNSEIIAIDEIRKKFGDGTMDKEMECKERLIEYVRIGKGMQIIEISGVGELGKRLFNLLQEIECHIIVVYLKVSIEEINKRIIGRLWDTPIPFKKENIPVAIKYTHEQFETGLLQRLMNRCPKAIYLLFTNRNIQLMNNNFEVLVSSIETLKKR